MKETVRIGPFHPALFEPQVFEVTLRDGKIVNVNMDLGYAHRSIEKLMSTKPYHQNVFLAERVCGICSAAHSTAYCTTVEKAMGIEISDRARYIRSVFFEMERLESHYLCLALLSHALGEHEHFSRILTDREKLMDLFELATGNRVHYGVNLIGGVRIDLTLPIIQKIRRTLDVLRPLSQFILQAFEEKGKFTPKIRGKGILAKDKAWALGVVGPTLRGSGVKSDVRKDDPYAAYGELSFEVPTGKNGDAYDRQLVRAKETVESLNIIEQALDNLPAGPTQVEVKPPPQGAEAIGRVEAPRGELIYFVKSNGTDVPERVKIRTPSYVNIYSFTEILLNQELKDFQIIIESTDPCFSCTDRVAIIDQENGKMSSVTRAAEEEVR